jgi:hypothetical protein
MQVNSTNVTVGDVNQILLSLGGVIQKPGTDFTVSGSTLTFTTAPAANTNFFAILLGSDNGGTVTPTDGSVTPIKLNLNDGVTITTDDNTDTLTLTSTDADANSGPNLRLYRNSGSPAVGDNLGQVDFEGRNDNSEDVVYASMMARARDETDGTEDGGFQIDVMQGGTLRSLMKYYSDGAAQELSFNDDSIDVDFRVESADRTSMLNVDAGLNKVGVGDVPDLGFLHVKVADSGATVDGNYDTLVVEESGHSGIAILSGTSSTGLIGFGDSGAALRGFIGYSHTNDQFEIATAGAERMRINSSGEVGIGLTSFDSQLVVSRATAGGSYALFGIHSASSGTVRILRGFFSGQAPDDRTSVFITMGDSSATRFNVHADGDVDNHDNFYGQISDVRIKSNITDANSQWDDIKAIKFRNFERKDDIAQYGDGKKVQLGVVAQELETISPGLVRETEPTADDIKMSSEFGTLFTADDAETKDGNDAILYVAEDEEVINGNSKVGDVKKEATHSAKVGDIKSTTGEKVKAVAYSVLYIKAAKALQEAMARIETLEADVKTLKGE